MTGEQIQAWASAEDGTLSLPASAFTADELWGYVRHLWVGLRAQNWYFAHMTDLRGRGFHAGLAEDVCRAALSNNGSPCARGELTVRDLHRCVDIFLSDARAHMPTNKSAGP